MIKRVKLFSGGTAWSSRRGWFWITFGGDIFSFMLNLGRFSVSFEKK